MSESNAPFIECAEEYAEYVAERPVDRSAALRPTTQMTIGCLVIPLIVVGLIIAGFVLVRVNASPEIVVPTQDVLLVRAAPEEEAPLLARFGGGRQVTVTGRSRDWRWLEVQLWDGRRGWALRPLDILVWQIEAEVIAPGSVTPPVSVTPVAEVMVEVPALTFTMGSPPGLGEADEYPAHPVSLSPFAIDRTEVTVGQYWACVIDGACAAPLDDAGPNTPHYYNDPAFDNHPAINIPWAEANNYCTWRGKRLPTEAEWEMAAGWDATRKAKYRWPWGSEMPDERLDVGDSTTGGPLPVGSLPADQSPAGLFDMGGNVSEWVFDWYKVDYYSVADDTNPVGPSHRRGEGSGRVVRGGSFADTEEEARTTNRRSMAEVYGYKSVGFRCAMDTMIR